LATQARYFPPIDRAISNDDKFIYAETARWRSDDVEQDSNRRCEMPV
jgi:hypothetical protein